MERANEREIWVGFDWGDTGHVAALLAPQTGRVERWDIPHTAADLAAYCARLRAAGTIRGIAIETPRHLVVQEFLAAGLVVYPINPKLAKAWRDGGQVQATKTDARDAEVLAWGLYQHREQLVALSPDDPLTEELRLLCHDEMDAIEQQTALVLRLEATLKEYYPEALPWFAHWACPTAWEFVAAFPDADTLRQASRKKLIGFFQTRGLGARPWWLAKIDARRQQPAWHVRPALAHALAQRAVGLAKQLRTLHAVIQDYRRRIDELFAAHPDAALFSSLPGAGKKLAPRLLVEFGADRARYDHAGALQQLSGAVPVVKRSGKSSTVQFRWACRKSARTTLHLFANCSRARCAWAQAFYQHARASGHNHALALRQLGAKWLKIIFRMWQERSPYDEARYLNALLQHGSPLVPYMKRLNT